jgi:hypothetical protein
VALQPQDPVGIELDPSRANPINLLIDIPLPGFIPRQINLIETEIASTSLPIFSSNYAVAWTGSLTEGRILAQSRSDLPITLDPCTMPSGEQSLTARLYNPLDFGLFFPLAEATIPIDVDPSCQTELEVYVDFETPPPPVTLPLTPGGDPITLTVFVTTPEDVATVDSDIMLLQDLSGSFFNDLPVLRAIAPDVVSAFPQACFGVSSFVDKPISPFGNLSRGDYVYRTDLPVSCDANGFISTINGLQIFSGGDTPESQLEALMQLGLRPEVGFRNGSRHIALLTTDAPFHQAGAFPEASSNNGDAILDGNPPGTGEDYPSVAQARAAITNANVLPIFLVTAGNESTYQGLASQLGVGAVVQLTSNSSNLIEALGEGLEQVNRDLTIVVLEDAFGYVQSVTPDRFEQVDPGATVSFEVTLQAAAGATDNDRVVIRIVGTGDLIIDVDIRN